MCQITSPAQGWYKPCFAFNDTPSKRLATTDNFFLLFQVTSVCRYVLDSVVTHVGVVHLTIQVWRALWNIMHHVILPDEKSLMISYLISLGIGYGACLTLFLFQHPFYLLARKLRLSHWILEHILEIVVKIAATIACVLLWRGGWGLCRDFLLKEEWQFWLAHTLCIGLLMVLQSSGTIGIPSVAVDCEFGWGTGHYYPIDFFLHWFYKHRFRQLSIQVKGYLHLTRTGIRLELCKAIAKEMYSNWCTPYGRNTILCPVWTEYKAVVHCSI